MVTNSDLRENGVVIRHNPDILEQMEPRLFDVDWLQKNELLRGSSAGRNQAYFLRYCEHDMVLRHFRRGGLFGKLISDLYFGARIEKTRAMREFELLRWMHGQGLPVPRPVAALIEPKGPFYRAALITERIDGARPFQELLRDGQSHSETWRAVGAVIRRMHDLHVFHSDLNCRNILVGAMHRAWLIDFDKCDRRVPGPWQNQNLERLKRSLRKESREHASEIWSEDDWSILMRGYCDSCAEFDGGQAHP